MRRLAEECGLAIDIESDDSKRTYGVDWYRFAGSCRALLGTESGSNVFDDEGHIAALAKKHADMSFDEFARRHLSAVEGRIRMNQVSPKIFEAIKLRTALILFEGNYSGVVQPNLHYVPLKKDYSNIEEVFARVQDLSFVRSLTDRAYRDVVESGLYHYRTFIEGVDAYASRKMRSEREIMIEASRPAPPNPKPPPHPVVAAVENRLRAHFSAVASEPEDARGGTPAQHLFREIWRSMNAETRLQVERRFEL